MKKRIFAVIMALVCLLINITVVYGEEEPVAEPPSTENVLVVKNINTGINVNVAAAKGGSYAATGVGAKLMTAMLAYEVLKGTDIKISTPLCVKGTEIENDILNDFSLGMSYSKTSNSMTVEDLVTAAVVSSAADACVALAVATMRYKHGIPTDYYNNYDGAISANKDDHENGFYSERTLIKEFVELMNQKAAELGCKDTRFVNCTGAHDEYGRTTAEDIALIAQAFYGNPDLMLLADKEFYSLSSGSNRLYNKSALMTSVDNLQGYTNIEGTTGIIVGWMGTKGLSPYCIVSAGSTMEGVSYIFVCVAKYTETAATKQSGYDTVKEFMPWALESFKYQPILNTHDQLRSLTVKSGKDSDSVSIVPRESVELLIPATTDVQKDIRIEYKWDTEELTAPVSMGQKVGTVTVYYNNESITTDLITNSAVSESAALSLVDKVKTFLNSDFMKKIYLCAIILFCGYLLLTLVLFIYRLISKYIAAGRGD